MKAVAGVAALVVGGTAVAAQAGSLPRGAQDRAHSWFSGLGVPPAPPESRPSPAPSGADPTTGPPTRSPGATVPGPASPGPVPAAADARRLCHTWRVANDKKQGKPMAAGPRRELAALAGQESDIPAFCAPDLAGSSATPAPAPDVSTGPSRPGPEDGSGNGNGNGNGPGKGNGGPKGGGTGKPGGNDTANAVVDGRAGPHE